MADIHLYGFQSAGTAIDQPREVIQKLLYHHLMFFTRIGDFTWRVSDCEELVVEVNHTTECVTDLLISICVRIVYCFTPSERNVG